MSNKRKKLIIYIVTCIILLSINERRLKKNDSYENSNNTYENEFRLNNIYFCNNKEDADNLLKTCNNCDVIIVDESNEKDPNMKILSSYRITNIEDMETILKEIINYNEQKNTNWDRSMDSMINEWMIHNTFSSMKIFQKRTDDVDLNNNDENIYKSKFLTRICRK